MSNQAYSIPALAERWGCSRTMIYKLLDKGALRGFRIGEHWRVSAEEVQRFEESGGQKEV